MPKGKLIQVLWCHWVSTPYSKRSSYECHIQGESTGFGKSLWHQTAHQSQERAVKPSPEITELHPHKLSGNHLIQEPSPGSEIQPSLFLPCRTWPGQRKCSTTKLYPQAWEGTTENSYIWCPQSGEPASYDPCKSSYLEKPVFIHSFIYFSLQ